MTVLCLAHLYAGNLGHGIGLIGGLQIAGKEVFLFHGLGTVFPIDTGTAQKKEFFYPIEVRRMNDIRLNHQIVVDKLGREC